jgi:HlyD family type I secretion membrane fusion protein
MMNTIATDKALKKSVSRHVFFSFCVMGTLVLGIGGWASFTEISGAVVASGNIVVETNIKQVQHQEGGIVKAINVKNGDQVEAGALLIQLDDTVTRANFAIVTKQLDGLYAQEARLNAEQDNQINIDFGKKAPTKDAAVAIIQDSQVRLFNARKNSLKGQKQQLGEQIIQFEKQIEGFDAQQRAIMAEISFVTTELKDLDGLLSKQLVSASRVSLLNREKAKLAGELGGFMAQIARTHEAISERKIQILQLNDDFLANVLQQLQDVRANIAQLEEQKISAEDQLTRIDVRAPLLGIIHNLNIHTIGHVLAPTDIAMLIVPQNDQLVIEAKVLPINIDQISAQQNATIRLPSFDQRSTPELKANVQTISADLVRNDATGLNFFQVRLSIPKIELEKLNGKNLVPGMPVEAFMKTDDRTVLSYLVKPIMDQVQHAMRER